MPTYEYLCQKCGHKFEQFQSITADAIKKCPKCGKNAVQRLISGGAGLIFKGSGFYITDYRDSSYADKAKAESGESKSSDTKPAEIKTGDTAKPTDGKSAEAKPAASGEAKPAAAESKPKAEPKTASKSASKTRRSAKS
jgi:putative FmdB family regulatory protein